MGGKTASVLYRLLLCACALVAACSLALAAGLFAPPPPAAIPLAALPDVRVTIAPLTGAININTATLDELCTLPGIGPHLAGLIIEARAVSPFYFPEDLKSVSGIGDRRLEQIKPYIRLTD